MKIIHFSMECYPMAKAGGMGDVVGALPIYLNRHKGVESMVFIPKYHNQWVLDQTWESQFKFSFGLGHTMISASVDKLVSADLGYDIYAIDIPGLFDRPGVYMNEHGYPYRDEVRRVIAFQIGALHWVSNFDSFDDIIFHCHDHHTGLIPFMSQYCLDFDHLSQIPILFTIHNGRYHGAFGWENAELLPNYNQNVRGLLDWSGAINSLATAIKCSTMFNTVSKGYLRELMQFADGLESLFRHEVAKGSGILNGIDSEIWDPSNDPYLELQLSKKLASFKGRNKKKVCKKAGIAKDLPLFVFIGRLVYEKGAELIPDWILNLCGKNKASCILLGTGDKSVEKALLELEMMVSNFKAYITYDEKLAHELYAAMDFLLMPSRVEPCGLNQMYAMRYGGIPIVRRVGGLSDSVKDISTKKGYGILFDNMTLDEMIKATDRAIKLNRKEDKFLKFRQRCFEKNFSWEKSTAKYLKLYSTLKNIKAI